MGVRNMSAAGTESDAEFDARYIAYFDRKDIDGWEIRKGMADLVAMDLVPEPTILRDHQGQVRRQGGRVLALHHAGAEAHPGRAGYRHSRAARLRQARTGSSQPL